MSKFSKTPAQNSKAFDDLWLDPVHKNFETAVKEMIESVCLSFITNSYVISSWLITGIVEALLPFSS